MRVLSLLQVGIDIVIKDNNGVVILSAAKTIEARYCPAIAEAVAIQIGMKLAAESGLLPAIIEFDSLSVIVLILADRPIRSEMGLVIEYILDLKLLFGFSSFIFSSRNINMVAHNLTKMALVHAIDLVLLEEVLPDLRMLV
ncbi:hypothetical protein ACOSP7_004841 [Xanthoceras sorbifolium]